MTCKNCISSLDGETLLCDDCIKKELNIPDTTLKKGKAVACKNCFVFLNGEYAKCADCEKKGLNTPDTLLRGAKPYPGSTTVGYTIKSSGKKRDAGTGATRDSGEGKGRFDLLWPFAIPELAVHMQEGAKVHAERNWEKGIPLSWFLDSAMRHLFKFMAGETDENHLAAAAWNVCGALDTRARVAKGLLPDKLNDIPPYTLRAIETACKEGKKIAEEELHVHTHIHRDNASKERIEVSHTHHHNHNYNKDYLLNHQHNYITGEDKAGDAATVVSHTHHHSHDYSKEPLTHYREGIKTS